MDPGQISVKPNQSQRHDLNSFDPNIRDFAIAVRKKSFQMLHPSVRHFFSVAEDTESNSGRKRVTSSLP